MTRRIFALAVLCAAVAPFLYTASAPGGPPSDIARPRVVSTPWPSEDLVLDSRRRDWRSPAGLPYTLRYSWLRCDLKGARCVSLPGLHSRRIVPPQELRIITIRGVVTASNASGSRVAVSRNFYFDEAGRIRARRDLYPPI